MQGKHLNQVEINVVLDSLEVISANLSKTEKSKHTMRVDPTKVRTKLEKEIGQPLWRAW